MGAEALRCIGRQCARPLNLALVSILALADVRGDIVRDWERLDESQRQLLGVWDVVIRRNDGAERTFQLTADDSTFEFRDRPELSVAIAYGRLAGSRKRVSATFELRDGTLSGSLRHPFTRNPASFQMRPEGNDDWRGVWIAQDRKGLTNDQVSVLAGLSTEDLLDRQRAREPLPTGALGGTISWTEAPTELSWIRV